jgi:hypothetical protein
VTPKDRHGSEDYSMTETSLIGSMTGRATALLLALALVACASPRNDPTVPDSGAPAQAGTGGRPAAGGSGGEPGGPAPSRDGPAPPVMVCGSACDPDKSDGCCPVGCTSASDMDCPAKCGNGVVEKGEVCDPPGSCPTSCPNHGCNKSRLEGAAAECTARCVEAGVETTCRAGDACCPAGCTVDNDGDCMATCDNGIKEGAETCDPVSECNSRQAACKSDQNKLREAKGNPATCSFECVETQRRCGEADGACPDGCSTDPDCKRSNGSACDGVSQCQSNRCTDGFCCAESCGTCEKCTGAGGTCQIPSGTKVCNGRCISSNDCCDCDTSTRCSGNRVVRGVCNGGSCSTVEVTSCSNCETCSGGGCRPKCGGNTRCVDGDCKKPDGANCNNGGECASGQCNGPKTCDGGSTADCPCTEATLVEDCESQVCKQRQKKCGPGYNLPDPGNCTHYP